MLDQLRAKGYSGIEASLADLGGCTAARRDTVAALAARDLKLVAGVYSSWVDYEGSWEDLHLPAAAQLASAVTEVTELARVLEGNEHVLAHVNVHSGGDGWGLDETVQFFRDAESLESLLPSAPAAQRGGHAAESPSLSYETHRARPLGNLFTAAQVCEIVPNLRLTLDFSHWVVAAERLVGYHSAMERQLLGFLAQRVDHIHARVGSPQSPQIAGPREAESDDTQCREVHHALWQQCWQAQIDRGRRWVSATPEYGPPPYTPLNSSGEPVYSVWEATERAAEALRQLHADTVLPSSAGRRLQDDCIE